jgi:mannose-6-phosphate isomerase-like protein (cupin superfamily)
MSAQPSAKPAAIQQPHEGRTLGVVGDTYRFLATGEDTAGMYAMWEAIVPPEGGPPPHIHSREEESFIVLEGEMTFYIGDERHVATPGCFARVPIGTLHRFKNESGKIAKMIITIVPAGLEQMFFETGEPLEPGGSAKPPSREEIERLLAAAPKYGVQIFPPAH